MTSEAGELVFSICRCDCLCSLAPFHDDKGDDDGAEVDGG